MLGILVADKPYGITSHDAVAIIRRTLGERRVGHAGTLDPAATGVLVMAVGPATRFLQYLKLEPKVYEGSISLGCSTDTQDAEGKTVEEAELPPDIQERLRAAAKQFAGPIEQLPPEFSAVKVSGRPMYDYARKGIPVERRPRTVYIHELQLGAVSDGSVSLRVTCSGGTYVRTLAFDLARAAGVPGHLGSLRRQAVGRFHLDQAVALQDADASHVMPLADALHPMTRIVLDEGQVARVRDGQPIKCSSVADGRVLLVDQGGDAVAVARQHEGRLQPECVVPRNC